MGTERQHHWENVYSTRTEDEVSWFEESPAISLALLRSAGLRPDHAVVDVGGGSARLVDALLAVGQAHVTVLDLSQAALDKARARLPEAGNVDWVVGDVTEWQPSRRYDFWHDRAALHFLTSPEDQAAYARVLTKALKPGGHAIIGTFAPDGPEKCSGLPVVRHDGQSLQALLGSSLSLVSTSRHEHRTPAGAIQRFQFSTFQRNTQSRTDTP